MVTFNHEIFLRSHVKLFHMWHGTSFIRSIMYFSVVITTWTRDITWLNLSLSCDTPSGWCFMRPSHVYFFICSCLFVSKFCMKLGLKRFYLPCGVFSHDKCSMVNLPLPLFKLHLMVNRKLARIDITWKLQDILLKNNGNFCDRKMSLLSCNPSI